MAIPATLQASYPSFSTAAGPSPMSVPHGAGSAWANKMAFAAKAYAGDYAPSLRTKLGAPNDNISINLARNIVDKSVSFLFGKQITFAMDDESTRSADEQLLDAIWSENGKDALLQRLATNGGIYGHVFVKIRMEGTMPRLLVVDPSTVTVDTAHDDYTRVNKYTIQWSVLLDASVKKKRHYRQQITRIPAQIWFDDNGDLQEAAEYWMIVDAYAETYHDQKPEDKDWITMGAEAWNFPFPPIVDCQNLPAPNTFWGLADIEPDVIQLIEAVNRSVSNINRIIRNHAHPRTYIIGLNEEQGQRISINPDGMIVIPGDPTQIKFANLEMQSDLASSLNFYERLREALYEISRTPEVASGKVQDLAYLSAMSMQILYGPMMEKTNTKRMLYGAFLTELNRRLLIIMGRVATKPVMVQWPETFPRDAQIESMTAMNKLQIGFSSDTLVAELGGDPKYERERRKDDPGSIPAVPAPSPEPQGNTTLASSRANPSTQPKE